MLQEQLSSFAKTHNMTGKGALCVALVVTRQAVNNGLPLSPEALLTENHGQVKLLGKSSVQNILKDYGIERVLAEEGGRTSRGSVGNMQRYVKFLNAKNYTQEQLQQVEAWWVDRVRAFFAGKPMVFRIDAAQSMRTAIRDLLAQAEKRQVAASGATIVGTVLQHLVGAKLSLILPETLAMHGASVSYESSGREGDFVFEDVAIHVTTAPSEGLIRKCRRNLDHSMKPIVITTFSKIVVAEALAEAQGIAERLEMFDVEQFLAGNIYELGKFAVTGRKATAQMLVDAYNKIIEECETDPSLKIHLGK
ncbi:MAG: DUF4928 family protein [Lentisphaerae bacterium]|jgi:hypothetical protein|nr:DUF4928 family protein [Lentisphaerota bacterium]